MGSNDTKTIKDMNTQEFEQAKREFLVSVMFSVTGEYNPQHPAVSKCLSDLTALLEQHKKMMLREELIAYDKFLSSTYWGVSHILKHEEAVDEYLKSRER